MWTFSARLFDFGTLRKRYDKEEGRVTFEQEVVVVSRKLPISSLTPGHVVRNGDRADSHYDHLATYSDDHYTAVDYATDDEGIR